MKSLQENFQISIFRARLFYRPGVRHFVPVNSWHFCLSLSSTSPIVVFSSHWASFRCLFTNKMSVTIEKTKYECAALPKRWQREEALRKPNISVGKVDVLYYNRSVRNDASLVPPIRQTASIFKQPVTVYKTQEGEVRTDFKHGSQEKPKQLIWEKRLEGLRACDLDGIEFEAMELPRGLKAVGPHVTEETIIQSVATALHVSTQPVTGQTGSKTALEKNPGVFLDPKQPLVQAVSIADDDIKRQEERVAAARKKLQDALRA